MENFVCVRTEGRDVYDGRFILGLFFIYRTTSIPCKIECFVALIVSYTVTKTFDAIAFFHVGPWECALVRQN